MDEKDLVGIYNGILFRHKKDWNFAICDNMNRPRGYAKWNKSAKDKYYVISLTYVI